MSAKVMSQPAIRLSHDLERGDRVVDGVARPASTSSVAVVEVALEHEGDLGLDARLEQTGRSARWPPSAKRHVVEQHPEVGLVDAELGLDGGRGQPDLAAHDTAPAATRARADALLDGVRRRQVVACRSGRAPGNTASGSLQLSTTATRPLRSSRHHGDAPHGEGRRLHWSCRIMRRQSAQLPRFDIELRCHARSQLFCIAHGHSVAPPRLRRDPMRAGPVRRAQQTGSGQWRSVTEGASPNRSR